MTIDEAVKELEASGKNTRFDRLVTICTEFFGKPRVKGSHHLFTVKWQGDPRINLQSQKGKAKGYQVKDVIAALQKLRG